jgi:hypothetical protein
MLVSSLEEIAAYVENIFMWILSIAPLVHCLVATSLSLEHLVS